MDMASEGRDAAVEQHIRRLLYISHFLSMWNSRTFEFAAFLFLATIYPQTLLPASVYALARAASAAVFSPWIGNFIDSAERLYVIRLSIGGQRIAVAVSCGLLYAFVRWESVRSSAVISFSALAALSVLACVEKSCAIMNTISVERDWAVVIAGGDEPNLQIINSQMRRIDLFCKLMAPLLISFIDGASTTLAIVVTGGLSAVSVLVEYFTIARVYRLVPELQRRPDETARTAGNAATSALAGIHYAFSATRTYLTHPAFLPSFSLALLYLTVLSFNGQMITYLIALGLSSSLVGVLRGIAAIFELSATWIAPRVMRYMGPIRAGIWFLNWQIFCVAAACLCLWLDLGTVAAATGTVSCVIASRIGLWGFDLSAQIIVQEEVEAAVRGQFSSQEFAFQNIFEMLSFASTIVFSRPDQFKLPATVSAGAVGVAGILYAAFVRARRGHLVHLSDCVDRCSKRAPSRDHRGWMSVPQNEDSAHDFAPLSESGGQERIELDEA
ncbi:putative Ferriportin iron efflux transporter [Neohortaea acidophila]|uniref:Solute carrier family 40 member n=1 Tax=Neohortaea acidophila TaxID=245834 RepID=A0A6A6PWR7_9PEZI|nr:putative Ferriportin iron efflux transporter [Neohortaea acidophila]KAF2484455.1 putative Ferriportin iron efflux transporter [Neohortaea acidophila]